MDIAKQKKSASDFSISWRGKGYEKGESQPFWLGLLRDVFGVEKPELFIKFETKVKLDHTSFIDGFIQSTHVLIEQKSIDKDLRAPIKQSDGSLLNPFQQAKRYAADLPYSERPRWIVTCNFRSFLVYDMENPNGEPEEIFLENLEKEYYRLSFLVESGNIHIKKEMEVSIKAGEIIGKIYDELLTQYIDIDENSLRSLNVLCVRLVFCLYAEDSGIFGGHNIFHDYLARFEPGRGDMREALIKLFEVLDTPFDKRDKYMRPELKSFPYCNGGLFSDKNIEIPFLNEKIARLLLENASSDFDWSEISPTIFGGVFESTLNPETRRKGGMHYTSIENIHKVIDPLFMDDFRNEFEEIKAMPMEKKRMAALSQFQDKLASLTFLDPACGSGNFLTETYISLRRLENDVIQEMTKRQVLMGLDEVNPVKVGIHQFYGIEINDFAVDVATTALWIAESQMLQETEKIINCNLDMLPLKTYHNIHLGNALRTNWEEVVPKEKLNYIIGNPPFVGHQMTTVEQKEDIINIFGQNWKNVGRLDYVCCWYKKSAELIRGTKIQVALVATNSITQGEQVSALWKPLINNYNIDIQFAYNTFRWDSEASIKAHVHCVIIGFSDRSIKRNKYLFSGSSSTQMTNINPYLFDAPNIFVENRKKPLGHVPEIRKGNQPTDGGFLIIEESDFADFINKEPNAINYIKEIIGAEEYINRKKRYCLWLVGVEPSTIRSMPLVFDRVQKVRQMRLASTDAGTRKKADTPHLFREINNPQTYIIVPSTSSENRRYVPMGFLDGDTISTNANLIIPNANLYHFGILISNVHMAWMRAVAGRLKSDYRYSKDIVYNNFPWPEPTDEQKERIEKSAQAILDARAQYPDSSLADLYNETLMPQELRKAHQENDRAVMAAYGFSAKMSESECVAELMKLYQKLAGVE